MKQEKVRLRTVVSRQLADFLTPVSLYLKVRDSFTDPVLLESNDFNLTETQYVAQLKSKF